MGRIWAATPEGQPVGKPEWIREERFPHEAYYDKYPANDAARQRMMYATMFKRQGHNHILIELEDGELRHVDMSALEVL